MSLSTFQNSLDVQEAHTGAPGVTAVCGGPGSPATAALQQGVCDSGLVTSRGFRRLRGESRTDTGWGYKPKGSTEPG